MTLQARVFIGLWFQPALYIVIISSNTKIVMRRTFIYKYWDVHEHQS
jgi:hypothetical protein